MIESIKEWFTSLRKPKRREEVAPFTETAEYACRKYYFQRQIPLSREGSLVSQIADLTVLNEALKADIKSREKLLIKAHCERKTVSEEDFNTTLTSLLSWVIAAHDVSQTNTPDIKAKASVDAKVAEFKAKLILLVFYDLTTELEEAQLAYEKFLKDYENELPNQPK